MKRSNWSFFHFITGVIFIIVLFFSSECKAQEIKRNSNLTILELKRLSDSAYGSDHELINGRIYYQNNPYAKGTPLFISSDWLPGTVTINQRLYENLELKYNIEIDKLILKATQRSGMTSAIILNPFLIDAFTLANNDFVNARQFPDSLFAADFVQIIYSGNILFLATYSKSFQKDFSGKTPYGKYPKEIAVYSICQNQVLTDITSKKALLTYFEIHKKEIKKFLKQRRFKFKKASPSEWHKIIEFCDQLTSSDN
ncbi:MAG: hypothetical protein KQH67_09130 [Bacteroidetes bacterium]|nr:hypothetical protein [Bacteroidota bacterium]